MGAGVADQTELFVTQFRAELATLGYVEGRNLRLDFQSSDGNARRLPDIAEAFVKERASVIVAITAPAARAALRATRLIPIIVIAGDFVAEGLGTSLANPGGNITGISMINDDLEAKRLEILKRMLPSAQRFTVLFDRTVVSPTRMQELENGARALDVKLQTVDVHRPADVTAALENLRDRGAEAVNILATAGRFATREQIGQLASTYKLPAICARPELALAGCLASYGTSSRELFSNLADLTDKMLKGASPANMPVRQPTKFELVINLKVAQALGLSIPQTVLGRADEVIEQGRGYTVLLSFWPVSPRASNVKNNDPSLIEPIAAQ
jgi:putative ABC transport system substrate-binding protein